MFMWRAIRLARRAEGFTSPNPIVGAVLTRGGKVIGEGWHRKAGMPHAEIEALCDAQARGSSPKGATLYVTLEPCSTHGRTPPCTDSIIKSGIAKLVVGAVDPNPLHAGRAASILKSAGVETVFGCLAEHCAAMNEPFNHWITTQTPFVTVKAAMSMDGKIATVAGESKWITGERARAFAMRLRTRSEAILVGVNTIIADDPELTVREVKLAGVQDKRLHRIILDSRARTPLGVRVIDSQPDFTTIVVTKFAPRARMRRLESKVRVVTAPAGPEGRVDLRWLVQYLGDRKISSLLVEGGGEVNGAFLNAGLAQRVAFFYAPMVLGGRKALRGVGGIGAASLAEAPKLTQARWRRLGADWLLTAKVLNTGQTPVAV